ncbi:hypothetical protein IEO21_09423 [Rhodonia placenta]|uniref:Phytase A n=1 Tax=Rhodonia placenta TaxID=104341 RepID=A0A8H7NUG3_9APHY|nr:hypothetical protein IEO21_09423 [Postia placenta]
MALQLQRHGARFPDDNASAYRHAVHQLARARKYHSHLKFMNDYEYALGQDDLIPLGATQSWASGAEAWARYAALLGDAGDESIFIRASDMPRVVDSAGNWSTGFAHASQGHIHPKIDVRLSEEANSTLNNDCPSAGGGTEEMNTWLHQFVPPIIKRLTKAAPGVNLSEEDVFSLMAMCPFESMAKARVDLIQGLKESGTYEGNSFLAKQKARSPFCNLFTKDEWRAFEFHGDVEKYYKTGPGNSLGPVQGVGYTNELLARLTNTPVRDNTTYNASLPFPLGRAIYVDFSHENAMVAVYAAIGLFNRGPHTKDDAKRVWVANRMVPFSARMVTERLECGAGTGMSLMEGSDGKTPDGTYVRIFVNDALQPLEFCGAQGDGLCSLEDFVESQGYARRSGDGDFERCYN